MSQSIFNRKIFDVLTKLLSFVFQYNNISATMMTIIFNKKDKKIKVSFKYQNYVDVFDEIDANELSEHRFHNYAIETKNKILFFEFIYNLFITELETLRKYLNDNLKKEFIIFFFRRQKHSLCSSKKKRRFTIMRRL